jgi:hypothetical protein
MKKSTALATTARVGPVRPLGASNRKSLITVAEPRLIAVKRLADDLTALLDTVSLPDDESEYPALLATLPTQDQFAEPVAMLERALHEPVAVDQARALCVLLLDGLGHRAGAGAKSRIAGLMIALQSADITLDDETPSEPISGEVLAATISRLFRKSKRAPLPCELLEDCLATRAAVARLFDRLCEIEANASTMRNELEFMIASNDPDYDHALDDHQRIPLW